MSKMREINEGLTILLTYATSDVPDHVLSCNAQHDVLYAWGPLPDEIHETHRERLNALGWIWSDDAWQIFT